MLKYMELGWLRMQQYRVNVLSMKALTGARGLRLNLQLLFHVAVGLIFSINKKAVIVSVGLG